MEQREDAQPGQRRPPSRIRRRGTGAVGVPARKERLEEHAWALGEREELADRRQAAIEERPGADDEAQDHGDPGHDRRRCTLTPSSNLDVLAHVGRRLAASQVRVQAGAAALLEAVHLPFRHPPDGLHLATASEQRRRSRHETDERPERVPRLTKTGGEQPDDQLGQREQHHLDRAGRQARRAGQGGDGAHPVASSQEPVAEVGTSLTEHADVANPGRRHHDHAGPAVMDPPAQLGVLAIEVDRRVEATEFAKQVGANQQIGRGQHEDVSHPVVLLLIDLTRFDDGIDLTEPVHSQTDRLQHARVVPVDELGADGTGIRPVHLLDHDPQRTGLGGDVVVTYQEEAVVALDESQHLIGRRTESDIGADGTNERAGQAPLDALVDRVHASSIGGTVGDVVHHEEEHAQVRVVLAGECLERVVEPVAGIVHDDDRDDRRCNGGLRFHDGARLATVPAIVPSWQRRVPMKRPRAVVLPQPPLPVTVSRSSTRRTSTSPISTWCECSGEPWASAAPWRPELPNSPRMRPMSPSALDCSATSGLRFVDESSNAAVAGDRGTRRVPR